LKLEATVSQGLDTMFNNLRVSRRQRWRLGVGVVVILGVLFSGCRRLKVDIPEPNEAAVVDSNMTEPNKTSQPAVTVEANEVSEVIVKQVGEVNETKIGVPAANAVEANAAEVGVPKVHEVNETKEVKEVTFHKVCDAIFHNYVDEQGRVNYRVLDHKKQELEKVLKAFAELDRKEYENWGEPDKIAMWINAYNIQMLKVIVDNYPIQSKRFYRIFWPPDSIRHIEPVDVLGVTKWDRYKLIVIDEEFTLSEIENRILGEEFDEPRVFLALCHGTVSGPVLRNEPYTGRRLSEQLDEQVRKFLSSKRAFRIDRKNKVVYLSAIFEPTWYGKKFVSKYGTNKKFKDQRSETRAVLNFISKYIPKQDKLFLERESYEVRYISYDWRLNDGSKERQ